MGRGIASKCNNDLKTLVKALELDIADSTLELIEKRSYKSHRERLQAKMARRHVTEYVQLEQEQRTAVKKLQKTCDALLHLHVLGVMTSVMAYGLSASQVSPMESNNKQEQMVNTCSGAEEGYSWTTNEPGDKGDRFNEITKVRSNGNTASEEDVSAAEETSCEQSTVSNQGSDMSSEKTEEPDGPGNSTKEGPFMDSFTDIFKMSHKKSKDANRGSDTEPETASESDSETSIREISSIESNEVKNTTNSGDRDDDSRNDSDKEIIPPQQDQKESFVFEGISIFDPETGNRNIHTNTPEDHERLKKIMFDRFASQVELQKLAKKSPLLQELKAEYEADGLERCSHANDCTCPRHMNREEAILQALISGFVDAFVGDPGATVNDSVDKVCNNTMVVYKDGNKTQG